MLVADSFRVSMNAGQPAVHGFRLHVGRFSDSVADVLGTVPPALRNRILSDLPRFLENASARIAEHGEGFPRLELRRGGTATDLRLALSLRPLPAITPDVDVRLAGVHPTEQPQLKGPNLALHGRIRSELGAEGLLQAPDGEVLEGTTTSLLLWDGDALVRSSATERVASVTEHLVCEIARAEGVSVRRAAFDPDRLRRGELWCVNALHGIRTVRTLNGDALPSPDRERLARFRARLDEFREPVLPRRGSTRRD